MANKALISVLMVTVMMSFLVNGTSAECCGTSIWFPKNGDNTHRVACDDFTSGTPCCAHGRCNAFCCNCDGGCRTGAADQGGWRRSH